MGGQRISISKPELIERVQKLSESGVVTEAVLKREGLLGATVKFFGGTGHMLMALHVRRAARGIRGEPKVAVTGKKKMRTCLCCGTSFLSTGPDNRMCGGCRRGAQEVNLNIFNGGAV